MALALICAFVSSLGFVVSIKMGFLGQEVSPSVLGIFILAVSMAALVEGFSIVMELLGFGSDEEDETENSARATYNYEYYTSTDTPTPPEKCNVCGGEATVMYQSNIDVFYVQCKECKGLCVPSKKLREAIQNWNNHKYVPVRVDNKD